MLKLSKAKFGKRLLLSFMGITFLLGGIFAAAKIAKIFQANAADVPSGTVTIESPEDNWVWFNSGTYPDNNPIDSLSTPHIEIKAVNGQTLATPYKAFCIDPAAPEPNGSGFGRVLLDPNVALNQKMKLAVYLATVRNDQTNAVMNSWFSSNNISEQWHNGGSYDSGLYSGNYPDVDTSEGMADFQYLFIHLALGYLNDPDFLDLVDPYDVYTLEEYLTPEDMNLITAIANDLGSLVANNSDVWQMAQSYSLYVSEPEDIDIQRVVWLEAPQTGAITVHKCDAEREPVCDVSKNHHDHSGDGSLAGIEFTVYDNNGTKITSDFTDDDGIVTFPNLPVGANYSVRETTTNASYNLTDSTAQTISNLTTNGAKLAFSDYIKRGNVTFVKVDDNGNPMANVAFALTSNTTQERHVVVTDNNGVVDTSSITHSTNTNGYDFIVDDDYVYDNNYGTWFYGVSPDSDVSAATINNAAGALPYDTYTLTELECDANKYCQAKGVIRDDIDIRDSMVNLPTITNDCASISTYAKDTADGDKLVEASATASITDEITYCARAGHTYTIQGELKDKATEETLATTTKDYTLGDNNCDTVYMEFKLDASELAGHDVVVFETLLDNGKVVASHTRLEDEEQTVTIISLDTYALDKTDEDKEVLATEDAVVTDHIKYCLVTGTNYTIVGTLINKSTGEPITVNGEPILSTTSLNDLAENCGELYLDFEFDATGLGGTEIVVFEAAGVTSATPLSNDDICLEHAAGAPDTCTSYFHTIITHADIDDATQTVLVATPEPTPEPEPEPEPTPEPEKVPDTGKLTSTAQSNQAGSNGFLLVATIGVVIIAGYFGARLAARKRFFGKK